jgi:hypothetical protein
MLKLNVSNEYLTKENEHIRLSYSTSNDSLYSRNLIYDKEIDKMIASQYNNIVMNDEAIQRVKKMDEWSKLKITPSLEGTMFIVFYHNDQWYITTRRSLDAKNSISSLSKTFRELFLDACQENDVDINKLNPLYCYHFILLHYENKILIDYSETFENVQYKKLVLNLVTEKYKRESVSDDVFEELKSLYKDKFIYPRYESIHSLDELLTKLNKYDEIKSKLTFEGYILTDTVTMTNYKIQTKIYQMLYKLKDNGRTPYEILLSLYKNYVLDEYIVYFPYIQVNMMELKKELYLFMKNFTLLVFQLFHYIRVNKENENLYHQLTSPMKSLCYHVYGIHLRKKSNCMENVKVTFKDVETFVRKMPVNQLCYYVKKALDDPTIVQYNDIKLITHLQMISNKLN